MITTLPTLAEACAQLRIGRVTLDKWCQRLGIEPQRHPQDWRYRTLTPEQVEQIRQERAKMPGNSIPTTPTPPIAPISRPQAQERAVRTKEVSGHRQTASETSVNASGRLPDGLVSLTEVADTHGLLRYMTTFRRWRDEQGKLDYDPGAYGGEQGRWSVSRPLTPRGLAQFYQLASRRSDFVRCDLCPHEQEIAEE